MATVASEMPPLHTAEALAGVQQTANSTSQPPSQAVTGSGGVGGGSSNVSAGGGIDSSQTTDADTGPTQSQNSTGNSNNTISAAADSSDNQPSTPQPHLSNGGDPQQPPTTPHAHHPYANHHIYAAQQPTTTSASSSNMGQMYPHNIYSTSSSMDMQHQQQQQPQTPTQHSAYPSYLNSYEQFYQQQQQQQHPSQNSQMDYINSNSNSNMYPSPADYKQQAGVRYHPYLHTPTSGLTSTGGQNANSNNALDAVNSQSAPVVSSASSSVMSPRVVSSTSPTSSSNHIQMSGSASSIGSMSAGNPSSPAGGGAPQCKKCGIMCTNDAELQEHIANVHGASPYGSSGYASSPYIKEELQQQTPPSQTQQQQQQQSSQQPSVAGGNPGEILDLDSQKMLYPPGGAQGVMPGMMHPSLTDPLQSMHSMQQRAGIATWDQQASEGLPPYMQNANDTKNMPNHSPYYQSPKLSPYHVSNSTNVIKSEYPIIKSEYPSDTTQQYMGDKSFDPTAPVSQQMMPPAVSSSPAEFPSTTTGGPQDSQQTGNQQFRTANFEPPTSSSALTTNVGTKAANWKSNEARRPKTYNCTACNKWFTSSGHLKRHYNTTLHKNAVKSSGQPDPATLPISVHHHPARDGPTGKTSRRGAAAAATAAANAAAQQQQQPPNPVQPPEPPNSPQDYGGSQTAAGGLTPMSHYAATPSPNSMYQQQQQQYSHNQYMPQVQSTTNASPQHASTMTGAPQQQPGSHHQQTVMNGHPNALAGPSVPTTRQQMPMPSSQMRGLLNTTTTITLIQKNNHMEAAMEDPDLEEVEQAEEEEQMQRQLEQQQRQLVTAVYVKQELLDHSLESTDEDLAEMEDQVALAHNAALPHMLAQHQLRYPLEPPPGDMERLYHNTTPNSTHSNMRVHSPLIISHQQYQEQLQLEQQQQQQQMQAQATYTLTQTPPPLLQQQQLHHSIMEPQHYINMPLATNTQQHSNMLQLQPQLTTMEQQQQQPDTTIPTTSMVSMLPLNHPMQQQLPHTELLPLVSTQLQQQQPLDTTNTSTQDMLPSHITTSNTTSIPSYHQLPPPVSELEPLDHTLTYPHTIIGNSNTSSLSSALNSLPNTEYLTLDVFGNLIPTSQPQLLQTSDGQLLQLITTNSSTGATTVYTQPYNSYISQRSPQEGDLPPVTHDYNQEHIMEPSMSYSPNNTSSSTCSNSTETKEIRATLTEDYINNNNFNVSHRQDVTIQQTIVEPEPQTQEPVATKPKTTPTAATKRKRNPSTSNPSMSFNCTMLPSGRIKCLPCDKEFTKVCYLTQHNKSFHSGEYPFRCQKCGKRYQSEDVYITHLGKHKTTEKAHKCDQCPKQFHHKTDLRRHIEAIHTGNKQHSCDICEKSFCRKDHLRKHLETHNRPRVVTKKTKAINEAFAKLQNKMKGEGQVEATLPPSVVNQIAVGKYSIDSKNDVASIATATTASPLIQQIEDVAADDDGLLEDDLEAYDSNELNEDEYISIQQYQEKIIMQQQERHQQEQHQHLQQQQQAQQQLVVKAGHLGDLGKQSYQIIEQDIPLYMSQLER